MQATLASEWMIPIATMLGLVTAGFGVLISVREQRPIWALLAAAGALAFLGLFVTGPQAPAAPTDSGPLPDTQEQPFERFYQQFRSQLGKRLDCEVQHTSIYDWRMACYTTVYRLESHPELAPPWNVQFGNTGQEYQAVLKVPHVEHPPIAPVISDYLGSRQLQGFDPLYWYGFATSEAVELEGKECQFFSKTALCWAKGAPDTSSVGALPTALFMWNLNRGVLSMDPWTDGRKSLLLVGTLLLLVSVIPMAFPGLAGGRKGWAGAAPRF